MKNDLSTFEDVKWLVDEFYTRARTDDTIGYIFNEAIAMDWEAHIPIICSFWDSVLFGTATYRGNVMIKHLELNEKIALKEAHFERWIVLWNEAMDTNFAGEKAEEAKSRAAAMKELMLFKIRQSSNRNFIQ